MDHPPPCATQGTVTVSAEAELPASAERVWEVLSTTPTPPELCEHPQTLEFALPGSAHRGDVTFVVHRHKDGTHCTLASETLELQPGRRIRSRALRAGSTDVTLEIEPSPTGCTVRYRVTEMTAAPDLIRYTWACDLARDLWRLRRYLGDPTVEPSPPPMATTQLAAAADRTARLAASQTDEWVDVTVRASRRLLVPAHAVWSLVADPSSGMPGLHGFRFPVPGSPPGLDQLWGSIGDHEGYACAGIEQVVELVPGRRVVTTTPFDDPPVTVVVELTPRVLGCRLDVQLVTRAPRGREGAVWFQQWGLVRRYASRVVRSVIRAALGRDLRAAE